VMVRDLSARAQQLRGADFANIFHALGTFGVHPGAKMLGLLLRSAEPRLVSMQPVELSVVYWGLGLLVGAGACACVRACMRACVRACLCLRLPDY